MERIALEYDEWSKMSCELMNKSEIRISKLETNQNV